MDLPLCATLHLNIYNICPPPFQSHEERVVYYIPDCRKAKAEISQCVIEAGKEFAEPHRAPWMGPGTATTMALLVLCMPRLLDCMKVVPTPRLALDGHPCACSPGNFPVIHRI